MFWVRSASSDLGKLAYVEIIVAERQIYRMQKLYGEYPKYSTYISLFFLFAETAGVSLAYHRGMSFTTKDLDNDKSSGNCALDYKGEWRYNSCHFSNLNGLYLSGKNDPKGMDWRLWKNTHYSVKRSEMKIRPKDFWDISGPLCQVKLTFLEVLRF